MIPSQQTPGESERYDFGRLIERRGTDSTKWKRYEPDVLPMWVADMDFPSPRSVVEAVRARVEHGIFGYGTEPAALRPTVQERMQRLYGWDVKPQDLLFVPGVVVGFNLASQAIAASGEGVLIQPPAYPPFYRVQESTGRTIETAPLVSSEDRYEIDFDAFERAITPRTRVFLLCNPHNPVGRVFTRAELERLAEICLRHSLVICSDEIHEDFVYRGHTHIPIASLSREVERHTVTVMAASKTYNIAGFHLATIHASNPELMMQLRKAEAGLVPHNPGVLDFVATLAAYQGGDQWLGQVLAYLQENRDFLWQYVAERLPGVSMARPEGTFLAWLDCRGAGIEGSPSEFFLKQARVALNEGSTFGPEGEGFVRLNFGCPRSLLVEGLSRMERALTGR